MTFRFRKVVEEDNEYKYELLGTINVEDYNTMFKTLTFMKEHKCEYCIQENMDGLVWSMDNTDYEVEEVSFMFSNYKVDKDEQLVPCFLVDLKEM